MLIGYGKMHRNDVHTDLVKSANQIREMADKYQANIVLTGAPLTGKTRILGQLAPHNIIDWTHDFDSNQPLIFSVNSEKNSFVALDELDFKRKGATERLNEFYDKAQQYHYRFIITMQEANSLTDEQMQDLNKHKYILVHIEK